MKHLLSAIIMCALSLTASAQFGPARQQQDLPGKPSLWNIRGKQYPRVLPDNRVVFRIQAPNAQKVQIDLGKRYDMQKGDDGVWTCTTDPQSEGFHYYFLYIDGVQLADPNSESFYGCSMMSSGLEIPYDATKADRFAFKDVGGV